MPAALPLISVVICTYNRADQLPRAIHSVVQQRFPSGHYEVIVVDNGSKDRTRGVVRSFEVGGSVRYVLESTPGLGHARNAGWRRARGQYVAYLDDDAIAGPGWLAAVEEAFAFMPGVGVVGGRVDPIWEGDRPAWLSNDIALSLTVVNWSDQPTAIEDVRARWLVGANMAVRRSVLAEVGGFHPGLDRVGNRLLSGGDVFLQMQIIRRHHVCLYYPKMSVRHAVPKARLQKRWFLRRYYSQGLSDAAMRLIDDAPSWRERLRLAFVMVLRLLGSPRRLLYLTLPCDDPRRFTEKCFCLIRVGHVAGLLGALKR